MLTGGESHGPRLAVILEGLPAGFPIDKNAINQMLRRRQHGFGRGGRQRIEHDTIEISGGLRNGLTLGSPLVMHVENRDWENWREVMDPWSVDGVMAKERKVTRPRPGHADYSGGIATDQLEDQRNVLERASARETAARVAAGAVCCLLLEHFGIHMRSAVLALGSHTILEGAPTWDALADVDFDSPLVTPYPDNEQSLVEAVRTARDQGETLGGVTGLVVRGLPPGLGSYVHWDRKLDGRLAQAIMSIPSVKAVALGEGLEVAAILGSDAHDPFIQSDSGLVRPTNHAGGLEGGVTNGSDLVLRAFFKPISTLRRGLPSVDLETEEAGETLWERSDVTAIGATPPILEGMAALVLADALLESLGGQAIADLDASWRAYRDRIEHWWSPRPKQQ
jgi:chorismate synthase